jgi:VWFA-related protein
MTGGTMLAGIFGAVCVFTAGQAVTQAVPQTPSAAEQQAAPRFRSSVDLVSVAAVVRDRKGRFVKNLSLRDFEIVEAGVRRPIVDFRAELDGPVRVGLLLDISGSMRIGQRTAEAKQAARHIFASLSGRDQAAVFTFDTMLNETQSFTSERSALETALDSAEQPFGQTSLYDAIAQTARSVAPRTGARGVRNRSAVVVITDGIDTRSRQTADEVSQVASAIDVPVYIVAVVGLVDDPRENPESKRAVDVASDLRELAQRTGGDLFITSSPAEASVAARQMVSELRHQYILAFEASSHAGWRPLEVRARQSSLTVRARTGYSGSSPSS